jgi:hypothetical protein
LSFFRTILEERYLYVLGLIGLGAGLPLGRAIISISLFVILGAFLFDSLYRNDWAAKWTRFKNNRFAVAITVIYLIHLLGLIYSSDMAYALKDLRIKLPLLFLPFIFSAMERVSKKERDLIILLHIAAVLISTLISYGTFVSQSLPGDSARDFILFCSHIRLSLMMVMAIFMSLYLVKGRSTALYILMIALSLWFIYYMIQIQAATGLGILLLCVCVYLFKSIIEGQYKYLKAGALLLTVAAAGLYLGRAYADYYNVAPVDWDNLDAQTALGNSYADLRQNKHVEHGDYIWKYYAPAELRDAWGTRSSINLKEEGQYVEGNLVRYLNAKKLRKDASGVAALSDQEIRYIEQGKSCPPEMEKTGFDKRLQMLLFELSGYANGGDPSGNSLAQRFEYWRAGWGIVKNNPIYGVGTGDVPKAFELEYIKNLTKLKVENRARAHNQYLTMLLTFGILGFIVFIYCMFLPLTYPQVRADDTYLIFIVVIGLSFLTEDTLETQQGLSFYMFYSGVLLLCKDYFRPSTSL